jgi:hypothetical protein
MNEISRRDLLALSVVPLAGLFQQTGQDERVAIILTSGPYFTALYHRSDCPWIQRGAGTIFTIRRQDADAGLFQPHLDCMHGGQVDPDSLAAAQRSRTNSTHTDADMESVWVRTCYPYLNGLYHRPGCWWLARAGLTDTRGLFRYDAEQRYFRAHQECVNKPPYANSTPPPAFANEPKAQQTQRISDGVTMRAYNRISLGMTMREVETIIGTSGTARTEHRSLDHTFGTYEWTASDRGWILISFRDDRVVSIHQYGLQ